MPRFTFDLNARSLKRWLALAGLAVVPLQTSGCALLAAGGAGYVAADEIHEGDGKADVLEDARDKGNGKN